MKAALVSATSLAALLAFEVGLDVAIDAQPANASVFTSSPGDVNFGYVLLNTSGGTTTMKAETVTNGVAGTNTITYPAVSFGPLSGPSSIVTVSGTSGSSAKATNTYTFAPTVTGAYSTSATISSGVNFTTFTLKGTAVAPVQNTTVSASTATITHTQVGTKVRIGTTATIAAITVKNVGDGDRSPSGSTNPAAQLQASIGTPSGSVFKGTASSFTLNDSHYSPAGTGISISVSNYTYSPTAHTGGTPDTTTVALTFANGSSLGTNASQTAAVTLSGTGIGPAFGSTITTTINGTAVTSTYSNTTALGGVTAVTYTVPGTVTVSQHFPTTTTVTITLANITSDTVASDPTLTDLTLKSFSLGTCTIVGCVYDGFSVLTFPTGSAAQLAEGGSVTMTLDYVGSAAGSFTSELNIATDQGAAFQSTSGAVFGYLLVADVPEPSTVLTFGMGLAGLGWARRRRAKRANSERRYGLI